MSTAFSTSPRRLEIPRSATCLLALDEDAGRSRHVQHVAGRLRHPVGQPEVDDAAAALVGDVEVVAVDGEVAGPVAAAVDLGEHLRRLGVEHADRVRPRLATSSRSRWSWMWEG